MTIELPRDKPAFFIGWSRDVPRSIRHFMLIVSAAVFLGAAIAGFGIGVAAPDPGTGDYQFPEVTLTGVIAARPQPILRLAPDETHKTAHAVLLSSEGTNGAQDVVADLDGKRVEIRGLLIKRGAVDMLEIAQIKPADGPVAAVPAPPIALGRWRVTGEICDGKCYTGAMRPGSGLAHKACAGICFVGGVPALFVSTGPIEGSSFLLIVDKTTGTFSPAFRDLTALRIAIEGEVERVDDLLIFRADPATAKVL